MSHSLMPPTLATVEANRAAVGLDALDDHRDSITPKPRGRAVRGHVAMQPAR